ncbi:aprataxin [Schizosaccharomyces cryophilus OY26]|uniref:Aprataxin n=1 Tax=Schizosaccharomyces cryophilus (strain OY26 / ATCC MYA-4695 / CBS 11777 / NBRC 106824 / NRRL Y48691) TaxID=653667 RepID=S9VYA0_SCHCR|nr:aprataxin [Schizosaccharomyces cryophilus OY26]EPY51229.1 aprataxin [Schizosaccharomyces cryophilus OY26]
MSNSADAFKILTSSQKNDKPFVKRNPQRLSFRDNLRVYIEHPQAHSNVLYYDEDFVFIRDKYPKSKMHLLLMPRDPSLTLVHPLEILAKHRELVEKLVSMVFRKLPDLIMREARNSLFSNSDLSSKVSSKTLWDFIKIGFHAGPSMNNLHLHVMTRDHVSPSLKHNAHYISFNSPFFVNIDTPIAHLPVRGSLSYLFQQDVCCYRCGKSFGRQFSKLKVHLSEELDSWVQDTLASEALHV